MNNKNFISAEEIQSVTKWVVSIYNSAADDGNILKGFTGTEKQAKEYLYSLVKEDHSADKSGWDCGTESVEEVEIHEGGRLYAFGSYSYAHYFIDYTAIRLDTLFPETEP